MFFFLLQKFTFDALAIETCPGIQLDPQSIKMKFFESKPGQLSHHTSVYVQAIIVDSELCFKILLQKIYYNIPNHTLSFHLNHLVPLNIKSTVKGEEYIINMYKMKKYDLKRISRFF